MIRGILHAGRITPLVFAALDPDSRYAPTDWLAGPGCNCCLPARHPRTRLLELGMSGTGPGTGPGNGHHRVVIDAGKPVLADRLARILRAMPFRPLVNIITA